MSGDATAGRLLWEAWRERRVIEALPADCRPADLDAGYRVQEALVAASGEAVVGYKIAATAAAGQAHLQIDHPISGCLLASRVLRGDDAAVPVDGNRMRLLEVEFAFEIGDDLQPRSRPWTRTEVMARVAALRLAIEVPDSRFADVASAGAAQLAADNACADLFVLGPAVRAGWRDLDLADHPIALEIGGAVRSRGRGGDALGDPRDALVWLADHLSSRGIVLRAGDIVTTGVCGAPTPTAPGDSAVADYGALGRLPIRVV